MPTWFVETPRPCGGWSPGLIHGDRPTSKGPEGVHRRFKAEPIEVRPEHLGLSLAELQLLYSTDSPDISPRYIKPERTREQLLEHALQALLYLDRDDGPRVGVEPDAPLSAVVSDPEVIEAVTEALRTEGG
jgi:hypothetical protein